MIDRLTPRTRLLLAVLVLATLVGLVAAKVNASGSSPVATASTHALVDVGDPSIVQRRALPQHVSSLQKRAELFGRLMTTEPVLARIARRADLPPGSIGAIARTTAEVPITLTEPGSEERASQIRDSRLPYRLELQSDPDEPVLAVYAQGPSELEAKGLADASVAGLRDYLDALARKQGIPPKDRVHLRQLGAARGAVVSGRASVVIAALTFIVAFGLTCAVAFGLVRLRRRQLRRGEATAPPPAEPRDRGRLDDWPRTTRVLPWLLAGFIAMLWLVPFNTIQLAVSMPVDLKLDRLVLPFVVLAWVAAFFGGRAFAPLAEDDLDPRRPRRDSSPAPSSAWCLTPST